jgi:phosphoglycolate phosphatase-like HAD superfamily hydrolase
MRVAASRRATELCNTFLVIRRLSLAMLPPPDFDALTERLEEGHRTASPVLLLLGRACGRLAGAPSLSELAAQALVLLDPDRDSAPGAPTVDQNTLQDLQRAFLSAFPTEGVLHEMLSYSSRLKVSPSLVFSGGTVAETVDRLFAWAQNSGQLDRLLSAAAAYNPGNSALRAISARYEMATASSDTGLDEFRARFHELSNLERYGLLQTIYRRIPVPTFYQELARIVKAGYIRHILTTNIDSLLEQALESLGLVRDVDFDVIPLGTDTSRDALSRLDANRPLVLKLHGDITQAEFGVTPDEIDYAVHTAKRFIKAELQAGAIVIAGYEGESAPLNDWLARASAEVWWTDAQPPTGVIPSSGMRWLPLGAADLFTALAARLLTLRATSSPPPRGSEPVARGLEAFESKPSGAVRIEPALPQPTEHELLIQEIARLKSETLALGQAGGTGSPLQRQEESAQRRRRIRELEDQLRALPDAQFEILALLDRIQHSVNEAAARTDGATRVDPATGDYLTSELSTVRTQYAGGQPNADIVSAALGAALVVLERLGPSAVNPQDVQALAAFGPSLTVRA